MINLGWVERQTCESKVENYSSYSEITLKLSNGPTPVKIIWTNDVNFRSTYEVSVQKAWSEPDWNSTTQLIAFIWMVIWFHPHDN